MNAAALPPGLRGQDGALRLRVHVVPGAKKTERAGWHGEGDAATLRIRLAAPPVDGKANDALIAWLAKELALRKSAITLLRGHTARDKELGIDASMASVLAWLAQVGW